MLRKSIKTQPLLRNLPNILGNKRLRTTTTRKTRRSNKMLQQKNKTRKTMEHIHTRRKIQQSNITHSTRKTQRSNETTRRSSKQIILNFRSIQTNPTNILQPNSKTGTKQQRNTKKKKKTTKNNPIQMPTMQNLPNRSNRNPRKTRTIHNKHEMQKLRTQMDKNTNKKHKPQKQHNKP